MPIKLLKCDSLTIINLKSTEAELKGNRHILKQQKKVKFFFDLVSMHKKDKVLVYHGGTETIFK